MATFKLIIEGQNADEATKDLLNISGLNVEYEKAEKNKKVVEIATIATIVCITGSIMTIAEQIFNWYQRWEKNKINKVIIVLNDDKRLLFENASINEIEEILKNK